MTQSTTIAHHLCNIGDNLNLPIKQNDAMRIVLFSDIHLARIPKFSQLFSKRFLGAVNHLFRRRHKLIPLNISKLMDMLPEIQPDCIICAGDLSSTALPQEFEYALATLKPLREAYKNRFFFVPGNHDAYVKSALPLLEKAFDELNDSRLLFNAMPTAIDFGNFSLLFINAARPLGPLLSCGVIDNAMQQRIDEILKAQCKPCIAVCHFPAINASGGLVGWRHGLRGAEFLRDRLNGGEILAILSGHVHKAFSHTFQNGGTQICSGSLTLHGTFAVVDIHTQNSCSDAKS